MSKDSWIGVDLDGTLAHYDKWVAWNVIGSVIKPMRERILKWVAEGKTVRIFTARAGFDKDTCYVTGVDFTKQEVVDVIQTWLVQNGMPPFDVTATKDFRMVELWDDRCVQVIPNTGRTLAEEHESEKQALLGAP